MPKGAREGSGKAPAKRRLDLEATPRGGKMRVSEFEHLLESFHGVKKLTPRKLAAFSRAIADDDDYEMPGVSEIRKTRRVLVVMEMIRENRVVWGLGKVIMVMIVMMMIQK